MSAAIKTNAMEGLRHLQKVAERIGDSASAYLDVMAAELATNARPAVLIGSFYVTFDGSLVYIARRRGPCKCSICTGKGISFFGVVIPVAGLPQPEPTAEPEDHGPREFIAVVITGGHGIDELSGSGPGESFAIDAEGWTSASIDGPFANTASSASLAMAGLSLRRRVEFRAVEPEEAT